MLAFPSWLIFLLHEVETHEQSPTSQTLFQPATGVAIPSLHSTCVGPLPQEKTAHHDDIYRHIWHPDIVKPFEPASQHNGKDIERNANPCNVRVTRWTQAEKRAQLKRIKTPHGKVKHCPPAHDVIPLFAWSDGSLFQWTKNNYMAS